MAMISAEAQRTLVKSPPELWAELSDPDSLARHLEDLGGGGEIRILSTEPETKVAWEGPGVSGVIELEASGWGTRVTLTAMREAPAAPEPVVESEPEAEVEPEPVIESEPEAVAEPGAAIEPEPVMEPEPPAEPQPKIGFWARLFRRRKSRPTPAAAPGPEPELVAEPKPVVEPEPVAEPKPVVELEPVAEPKPVIEPKPVADEPRADLAAELVALEESMANETTAILTAVLDRLGQAHHRPFSRA